MLSKSAIYMRKWRAANPERNLALARKHNAAWRTANPTYGKTRYYERLKTDPAFRACKNTRSRINDFLQRKAKYSHSLGCTQGQFRSHIEAQFRPGMTWENYGEWEIDHKYPIAKAYTEGAEAFARACRFENLQPLWAEENRRKSDGIDLVRT